MADRLIQRNGFLRDHGKIIDAPSLVDFNFVVEAYTRCDKAACAYFVAAICPPGGGGFSRTIWVGVCGPLPKTLTLFMTTICAFPYPIYDLTKNLIPYLWPDPLRWTIHIINPVDKTKLSCNTPHRRSTTVSLETCPLYSFVVYRCDH